MIHRALFGSIERFFAVLLEHYAGAFPAWLAPVQVLGVPVADEFAPHLAGFVKSLEDEMVRCEIDYSDDASGRRSATPPSPRCRSSSSSAKRT